ncbi:ACT domain-containing protein ACR9-like [Macadamia integrifolia]|uniref:ACT domain-containing protein ACR9-like n=1 Tax=Macadamia integrifolia TaxID=60698 RepID=UPI001C4E4FB7|nr:ACT domain-containing protein ACR9-like [Macadamia integrifolia]XP_042510049.1 ACT domain-containing protein ACR9-like [Macadamia integrifolia]XP_042510050.1 ACT domain-containing protein ACR9-like [Macadamia integrifolia]
MGVPSEDVVLIQKGKKDGEPYVITVNCPGRTGLGCDLCRIILEFGLRITKGDVSTDGIWCYIVLWVVPHSASLTVRWPSLKNRLLSVCPSCAVSFYFNQPSSCSKASPVYLLKYCCLDRKGLLHDVTQVLCELELTIQRVKVMTTPDGRVVDLFFITDSMDLLHTKQRWDDTCKQLHSVLGESCIICDLQLARPEYQTQLGVSSLPPEVAEEIFNCELSDKETRSQALSPDLTKLKKASVMIDNSLSPAHTLLQIHCVDQKGLLYDIMRPLKDCNIQIAYGRFSSNNKDFREVDLFIQQTDGKKIVDVDKQNALCSRLKVEMLHPLRVIIANRGPDTELLVANPVELSGKGRPRVFYDVTLALKVLGICIFSAEIGRHSTPDREWEVYRFLLDESCDFQLSDSRARNHIVDRVRRTLMGW